MSFSISKEQLIDIVDRAQKRKFAQEVEFFEPITKPDEWLLTGLNSSMEGIRGDEEDINERLQVFGSNEKKKKDPPGLCDLLLEALEDVTLRILIVAALISIVIEVAAADPEDRPTAWIEGAAILLAVFISAGVTAINDYRKERQFRKLNDVSEERKMCTVLRNGKIENLHQDLLLVGDIICLNEGMEIPADGYLIKNSDITTDESAMTGETDPLKKCTIDECLEKLQEIVQTNKKNEAGVHDVPSPVLFSGTKMLTGEGKMVVIVVGDYSAIGKIRALLAQDENIATPLQMKLEIIAGDIGKLGLFSAILILLVLLIRFTVEKVIENHWDHKEDFAELVHYFILAITVVVVAIPEGLPLAVTLSLAFSVQKMLDDANLVRKMEACETMGGANNICSDKTGTLTKNRMTLTTYWNDKTKDFKKQKKLKITDYFPNAEYGELFKLICCINNSALLYPVEKGSSVDQALLRIMEQMGYDYQVERDSNPVTLKFPFSSARKIMSSFINLNGKEIMMLKGASEIVLRCCDKWHQAETGQVLPIDAAMRQTMETAINSMAEGSLRTLCLAYKTPCASEDRKNTDERGVYDIEKSGFTVLTIIGVQDPARDEVPDAIDKCRKAGITVRMVTGDNLVTARAIAKDVGIITKTDTQAIVMQGADFNNKVGGVVCKKCRTLRCPCPINKNDMDLLKENKDTGDAQEIAIRIDTVANAEEFDKLVDNLLVLARSRPEDKYCLVTGLKERGNVVAVTGDGTNDAPALKKADVGFAMGLTGTEVAKDAADIILQDDNFTSIVKAVMWGRNIYDSIRKFVQFQLTVNVVAVFITFVGAAMLKQQILQPIQMLWVNLIMDTLGSLALATEQPTEKLLDRAPHSRDSYIVSKTMFKHIIGQAIYQIIVLIILVFAGEYFLPEYADTFDQESNFESFWKYADGGTVRNGSMRTIKGDVNYEEILEETKCHSRHYTIIFTAFVMMQVFNFLNSRKIDDEINIFSNITANYMFSIIVAIIFALQIILVTFGGYGFGVYSYFGLHIVQWVICIAFGSGSLVVSVILKMLPIGGVMVDKDHKEVDGRIAEAIQERRSSVLSLKRKRTSTLRNIEYNHMIA